MLQIIILDIVGMHPTENTFGAYFITNAVEYSSLNKQVNAFFFCNHTYFVASAM